MLPAHTTALCGITPAVQIAPIVGLEVLQSSALGPGDHTGFHFQTSSISAMSTVKSKELAVILSLTKVMKCSTPLLQ